MEQRTIQGHPEVDAHRSGGRRPLKLTVCAGCGALRSILWLNKDRWLCTKCGGSQACVPTQVPLFNPSKRR